MRFRSCRTWVATVTAVLFVLSAVAQHAVAAGMSMELGIGTPAATGDMVSHDDGMPCPSSSDCGDRMNMPAMACFAHCATVLGVLAEPVPVPVTVNVHPVERPAIRLLTSLHGPPDSPPPKSRILI